MVALRSAYGSSAGATSLALDQLLRYQSLFLHQKNIEKVKTTIMRHAKSVQVRWGGVEMRLPIGLGMGLPIGLGMRLPLRGPGLMRCVISSRLSLSSSLVVLDDMGLLAILDFCSSFIHKSFGDE